MRRKRFFFEGINFKFVRTASQFITQGCMWSYNSRLCTRVLNVSIGVQKVYLYNCIACITIVQSHVKIVLKCFVKTSLSKISIKFYFVLISMRKIYLCSCIECITIVQSHIKIVF